MVYYLAYYGRKGFRSSNYAAEDKIDYICETLESIGEKVTIISSSKSSNGKFQKSENIRISSNREVVFFSSIPRNNTLLKVIDSLFSKFQLMWFFLIHIHRDDTVLVYHSLAYGNMIKVLHGIKKFKYILEVEELYQYIRANTSKFKSKEDSIIQNADGYIFSNSVIGNRINTTKKMCTVVNGVYKSCPQLDVKKRDRCIVYAGTLEPQKGIDYVLDTAELLPTGFEIHVAGFGSQKDIDHLLTRIEQENKKNGAQIIFDGSFKGSEYIQYLQTFKVGICIQNPDDDFNKYEFPSKVFSYMSNGLQVVANDLIQLRNSSIFPYLHISTSTDPKDIALAIIEAVDSEGINCITVLNKLNEDFKKQMKGLIGG